LYEKLSSTVICTDPASAETIKYAANAFLATKLSFINAIAAICEGVGADVNSVIDGIGSDPRIGRAFLQPGPGWGGSCFPKDSRALLRIAEQVGHDFHLLRSVITANLEQFDRVVSKVREAVSGSLEDKTVAVWGLTFKAGTDDLRASPALEIVSRLLSEGARVQAYDPMVESPKSEIPTSVELHKSPENSCVDADVLVLLTEWEMFCSVSPKQVASLMKGRALIDARNLLSRSAWQEAGFSYCGIGR
jgi:UDPglucose 6-dehydrogenase